ncbi:MAG: thioredoxin domain-containing protein [SAR324 cluster bacterium]|nr:thioredoxin domain-containing protein [SAR324 cluster bacterium]
MTTALFFQSFGTGYTAEPKTFSENPMIGKIGENPVLLEEVRNKKIYDLSLELYQRLQDQFILHTLRALEGKYDGITSNPEVSVSEQQILAVYKNNNLKERGSLNQLRPQIRQYLSGQLRQEKLLEQFLIAQEKGWITSYLSPPTQFTISVPIKTAFIRGNSKASVMVLEFSDYQCPYCARIQRTIGVLLKKYRKTVAFGYRHFPLGFHTEADEAAISVECAREQNKFVEMHQVLYENQKAQFPENLKQYARRVGVKNIKKFNLCLESERYRGLVEQDLADGAELGITGTPGFLVGRFDPASRTIHGELLSGAQPLDAFEKLINKFLQN